MIYPFRCPQCGEYTETVRQAAQASDPETCKNCGETMDRVFTAPQFSIDKQDYFNHGLGVHVRNKGDVQEAIRRLRDGKVNGRDVLMTDEKGKKYIEKTDIKPVDIVEVGNERPKVEKQKQSYDLPRGLI